MPIPERDYRFQKAQLWERLGTDRHSNPIIGERREIIVRWENTETQVIGPDGQPIKLDAMVVADISIPNGSIMWEGDEGDLPDDTDNITNLMEVITYSNIPDVKGRHRRRTYGLKRYTAKLPTVSV